MNKTKWYTRPVYLLVALAVVVSLGVGGIVQPNSPQVSADNGSESLIVDIVKVLNATGVEKTTFAVGECYLVNAAVAYKDIEIEGTSSVSVSATIDPGQYATLASGEVATKALGSISRNSTTDVWWRVCCTGEGSTTITVNANSTGLSDSDSVLITQGTPLPDVLEIELIECPGDMVLNQSDDFVIKARVNNTHGSIVATDVWGIISGYAAVNASLTAGNPDRWELGDIWPGESAEVMWNLHCDGCGQGYVTIDAEASNLEPSQIAEAQCYVDQGAPPTHGPFWVKVDAPPKICSSPCCFPLNQFQVNATVCNSYGENATNVTATLSITGPAHLITGDVATHNLTNSTGGSWILNGTCANVTTWNVSCTALGTVTFNVTADGIETWAIDSDTATTSQQDYTLNIMDVTNPKGQNLNYPTLTGETTTVESCQNFTVNSSFQNCLDEMLSDVNFTIDLPDSVELAPGSQVHVVQTNLTGGVIDDYPIGPPPVRSVIIHSVCSCCHVNLTWTLHCKGSTEGAAENITVTAYDELGAELDNDYFKVIQIEKAHLAAGIEVYPGWASDNSLVTTPVDGVYVCQNFTIVIPVFNLGEAYAYNISANYTITGNTSCATGANGTTSSLRTAHLDGGTAYKILIPCHCDGEEDLNITVNFINGTDEITGEEIVDANKYVPPTKPVMQIPFEVVIIQPEDGATFNCSDEFAVKINITNNSTDPTNNVSGVMATLTWTGPGCAEFVDAANQSATIDVGAINYNSHPQEAAWLMHCCGMGNVTFTVTVNATEPLINIQETVTVTQQATTSLEVVILSPEPPPVQTPTYATCEEFAVTANVSNSGDRPSETVTVGINAGTYANVVSGSNPVTIAGGLAPGASQIVSWTLHVYKAGVACDMLNNPITVTATAPCASQGSDGATVDIYPAAHLVVEASAPTEVEVGSNFNVTVTVNNTGWADASQVVLRIDTGDNSALSPGEKLTKTIGTLVGFTVHQEANVTWILQCEGVGKSTIIITPEGNDECGWHSKQNATTGEPMWKYLPGMAINPDFLEPDDVTVEQKTIVPGDEVNTLDIVTDWNFISVPKNVGINFSVLLNGISFDSAYAYDPVTGWALLTGSEPVEVLDGYWIDSNEAATINLTYVSGGQTLPPSKDLTGKAWNAIGFSSTSETGLSAVATLKSVEGSWTNLLGWDAAGQSYEGAIIFEVNDNEKMYPTKGYWLWVTADTTLAAVSA